MDFARKQLEKYGWTAGKGLGKYENGISEALKPKLKRSVTGVGHDPASDFTDHWWHDLYNKAIENLEVEEVNGKIKRKDPSEFEITNNAWQIKKRKRGDNSEQQYTNYFVKTEILSNGGSKVKNVKGYESEDEETRKDVYKMTDEELFVACEGRTAHKGARHGIKALGKLARIEQQEQILLNQSKYVGYSTAKKGKKTDKLEKVVENNYFDDVEIITNKNKRRKKKYCDKEKNKEAAEEFTITKEIDDYLKGNKETKIINPNKTKKTKLYHMIEDNNISDEVLIMKKKKRKNYVDLNIDSNCCAEENGNILKKQTKIITKDAVTVNDDMLEGQNVVSDSIEKRKKNKKKKNK